MRYLESISPEERRELCRRAQAASCASKRFTSFVMSTIKSDRDTYLLFRRKFEEHLEKEKAQAAL